MSQAKGSNSNSSTITKFFKSEQVVLNLDKDAFKRAIVNMVVHDAMPLYFFSSSIGFQTIVGQIAKKLEVGE